MILLFFPWSCKPPFSAYTPFPNALIGVPVFSLMVSCKHPPLYQYVSGRISEEASISGSASKYYLTSAIVRGFCGWQWGGSQVRKSLDDLFFNPCSSVCPCISSHELLFSLLRRTEKSAFWPSFSLSFIHSVDGSLGIPSFLYSTYK